MRIKHLMQLFIIANMTYAIFNFSVWELYTKKIFLENKKENFIGGDLSRLGYISTSLTLRKRDVDLPIKHYEESDILSLGVNQHFDIMTIGDSFSNGGGGGKNPFYADYIATSYNQKILNFQVISGSFLNTPIVLANSGMLEKLGVKTIILESVERSFIERMTSSIDEKKTMHIQDLMNLCKDSKYHNNPPEYSFINDGNIKFVLYSILRNYSDNGFINIVYKVPLKQNLFTAQHSNDLLFYGDDIKNNMLSNEINLKIANDNLNNLAKILKKHGVKLIVLATPNKYTIYSDFMIEKNKYGRSSFFEDFSKLSKNYEFINSKTILQNAVTNGIKDIYYPDDTHWSYKASELIVKSMHF